MKYISHALQLTFKDITFEKAVMLGEGNTWYIKVKIRRLWSSEWGNTSYPHRVGWQAAPSASKFPFLGNTNTGVILIESCFNTLNKRSKVTRFITYRSHNGAVSQWDRRRAVLYPRSPENKRLESRVEAPIIIIKWLRPTSLTFDN